MAELGRLIYGKPLTALAGALLKETHRGTKVMIIADSAVVGRYGAPLRKSLERAGLNAFLIRIPAGERSKTLAQAERLYQALARLQFERKSWLVALGGGVIGDLTGFVASTYLRGMPYVQVPTTLLAQVDSSIGGKTGVDLPEGKNLVGAFYHPRLIWITPELLKSLPAKHWRNGMAEVIKYGAIFDAKLFDTLERKMEKLLKGFSADWRPIIARCAEIKQTVVRQDPRETKGLRAILNFGHTLGHAIEASSGYRDYLHGEAIAIGMTAGGMLSEKTGLDGIERIRLRTLLKRAGLPAAVKKRIPRARLLQFLGRDKKVQDGAIKFVLLKGLGKAVPGQVVTPEALAQALSATGL